MCMKFANRYFVSIYCFLLAELHVMHEEGHTNTSKEGATQAPELV